MCISIAPVSFGNTVTGLYEADDKTHVIFYQNVVSQKGASTPVTRTRSRRGATAPSNWTGRKASGNALVIPIMTDDFKSIRLLSDTADTPDLLADVRRSLQPPRRRSRGSLRGSKGMSDQVIIQQFDIYTLVLAPHASLIPDAIKKVPAAKRPPLEQELFNQLEAWYDCPFAVACFSDADAGESKPVAYAYSPKYPDYFMIYTLDGHDGSVPNLDAVVDLDHTVFAGSYRMDGGKSVAYSDEIPAGLEKFVPRSVVGKAFPKGTRMINGDIVVAVEDVVAGRFSAFRAVPPNAGEREPLTLADAER
ncbi:MAG: hypothetical protein KC777_23015 [Cyanobacteria bacterium HKST-UBA02]|nr:hypothetical protein [Cyanobacteria bacterium HKST-UBA02]